MVGGVPSVVARPYLHNRYSSVWPVVPRGMFAAPSIRPAAGPRFPVSPLRLAVR